MTDAMRFKIEDGVFALALVDTAALGYVDTWQSPGGLAVDVVTLADYDEAADQWRCQIQTATIDPSANNNDETVNATWCKPQKTIPNPGETSYAINGTFVDDPHVVDGLSDFLYANDTKEAYFYMGLGGDASAPAAIGRLRIIAGTFGGDGHTTLTNKLNALPLSRRYDRWSGAPGSAGQVTEGLTGAQRPGVVTLAATAAAPASGGPTVYDDDEA